MVVRPSLFYNSTWRLNMSSPVKVIVVSMMCIAANTAFAAVMERPTTSACATGLACNQTEDCAGLGSRTCYCVPNPLVGAICLGE